jgi:hypothetical protein
MKTQEFINKLSDELKTELSFRQNPNYPEMGMVFFSGVQVCSAPMNEIYDEVKPEYGVMLRDKLVLHPNKEQVRGRIISFIHRWNTESGFKELMTEAL